MLVAFTYSIQEGLRLRASMRAIGHCEATHAHRDSGDYDTEYAAPHHATHQKRLTSTQLTSLI